MCSHRLAAVSTISTAPSVLALVNSSRAWSSSGGVVVIEHQVEVLRTVAGGQIAVLLPEELPQLSPPAARALLRLLHNVAESDGRGARGSTRAA